MAEMRRIRKSSAAKIVYYLTAVDGDVSKQEKIEFRKIAEGFGVYNSADWEGAAQNCKSILNKRLDQDWKYNLIKTAVGKLLSENANTYLWEYNSVSSYLLIWNMMTLSIVDGEYSENEDKLIKYVAEECGVDKTVLLEMDNALRALYAISNEEKYLKMSGKPEKEIKPLMSEMKKRKNTIKDSISIFFDTKEEE